MSPLTCRITHKPTGVTVSCSAFTTTTANREGAMRLLRGKLRAIYEEPLLIRSYRTDPPQVVIDYRTERIEDDADRVLDGGIDGFIRDYWMLNE